MVDTDALVRRSTVSVVIAVALGAAVVSYRHAYDLVHAHGETGLTAAIVPATIDGMIYASSMVLLQSARRGGTASSLAYVGLGLGIVATVAANVAHGWAHGVIGALVGAWPAVALVLSYEMLMWIVRAGRLDQAEPERAEVVECGHRVAMTLDEAVRAAVGAGLSQRKAEGAFGIPRTRVKAIIDQARPPADEVAGMPLSVVAEQS